MHIVAGEWAWLEYWNEPVPDDAFHADLDTRLAAIFNSERISQRLSGAVEVGRSRERTNRVRESHDKRLPGKNDSVPHIASQLGQLMQHLANHSTYHRGQVALMMRQLNAEPLPTNFHEFLLEEPQKA